MDSQSQESNGIFLSSGNDNQDDGNIEIDKIQSRLLHFGEDTRTGVGLRLDWNSFPLWFLYDLPCGPFRQWYSSLPHHHGSQPLCTHVLLFLNSGFCRLHIMHHMCPQNAWHTMVESSDNHYFLSASSGCVFSTSGFAGLSHRVGHGIWSLYGYLLPFEIYTSVLTPGMISRSWWVFLVRALVPFCLLFSWWCVCPSAGHLSSHTHTVSK